MGFGAAFWTAVWGVLTWALASSDAPGAFAGIAACGVVIGIAGAYFALGYTLNSTNAEFDGDFLRVSYGPIPWRRGHRVRTSSIEALGLYEERYTQSGEFDGVNYGVRLILDDGRVVRLYPMFETELIARTWLGKLETALAERRDGAQ